MSLSALHSEIGTTPHAHATGSAGLNVEVSADFAALSGIWHPLQADGIATPYQHFAFAEAYFRHVEQPAGGRAALIVIRDGAGAPLALLPLAVTGPRPFAVARFIGGKHSNFNMPLLAKNAPMLSAGSVRDALRQAARIAGIDAFAFHNQPVEWEGTRNPFAAIADMPSPSNGYRLALEADGEKVLVRLLSKDTRRKMRQKEQKLAAIGAVSYRKAATEHEALAVLDRFYALKAERFAAQGIADPFAGSDIRRFLNECAVTGLDAGRPAMELHTLHAGERIVAMFSACTSRDRFSALMTAFDGDTDIARCSPGDILLNAMIRDAAARGFATFDLGVGEAHYKDKICDGVEELVESFVPASAGGHLLAATMRAKQVLKRAVKTSDAGKNALALLRRIRSRS